MTPRANDRDERRLLLRRRLYLAGLLPLLAAVLLAAKVGLMLVHDHQGRGAYDEGRWDPAGQSFAANRTLNLFEPWLAPFNEGAARYRAGDLGAAADRFEEALPLAPSDRECTVRVNLAIVWEAVGDRAAEDEDLEEAVRTWRVGRDVLATGDCPQETARAVDGRLEKRLARADRAQRRDRGDREERREERQRERRKEKQIEKKNEQARRGANEYQDFVDSPPAQQDPQW